MTETEETERQSVSAVAYGYAVAAGSYNNLSSAINGLRVYSYNLFFIFIFIFFALLIPSGGIAPRGMTIMRLNSTELNSGYIIPKWT